MSEDNIVLSESIQLAPFRSINEFLLDKARYQLPTLNDLKKWNNRVVTNLLYYQTNYFAVALSFVLISCFLHSQDILVGISAVMAVLGAVGFALSKNAQFVQLRANYPYGVVILVGVAGYYFVYVLPAVITLLFTFALPLLLTFVHASLRLRNFSAKVNIKMEQLRLNQTVMGQIMDLLGVVEHYN